MINDNDNNTDNYNDTNNI